MERYGHVVFFLSKYRRPPPTTRRRRSHTSLQRSASAEVTVVAASAEVTAVAASAEVTVVANIVLRMPGATLEQMSGFWSQRLVRIGRL